MPLYEVLAALWEKLTEAERAVEKEFEELPKEQRTPHKKLEMIRQKLAEWGEPFVYARVNAKDAEEAKMYAEDALLAAKVLRPPGSVMTPEGEWKPLGEWKPRVGSIALLLPDEVFIDPPPEGNPAAPQPEHLILGAAAALWIAALLLSLKR
jgi:hypothetical protein